MPGRGRVRLRRHVRSRSGVPVRGWGGVTADLGKTTSTGGGKMVKQFLTAFLFTLVYAIIRYAGFGNVSLIHAPVYIMNKAVSMTAVVALFMAALGLMRAEKDTVRFWTKTCSHLVFLHIFLSLGILSKGYFAKFFSGDKMSLTGEVVLLMGVLAAYCFWRLQATRIKPALQRTLTILACALVAGHLFAMGFRSEERRVGKECRSRW